MISRKPNLKKVSKDQVSYRTKVYRWSSIEVPQPFEKATETSAIFYCYTTHNLPYSHLCLFKFFAQESYPGVIFRVISLVTSHNSNHGNHPRAFVPQQQKLERETRRMNGEKFFRWRSTYEYIYIYHPQTKQNLCDTNKESFH